MTEAEEYLLIQQLANGNEAAFERLVEKYWNNIYAQSMVYLRSSHEAQDLTQEVFMTIWEKRRLLGPVTNFRSYIFTIARNQIINQVRKKLKAPVAVSIGNYEEQASFSEEFYTRRELSNLIEEGIRLLPRQQQKAYLLSRDEGLSYEEVAEKMQTSKEATKKNIGRALHTLRSFLRANYDTLFLVWWQLMLLSMDTTGIF